MRALDTSPLVIPPAIYQTPRCPICGGVLSSLQPESDGWGCSPCGLIWPDVTTRDGVFADPDVERCGAELAPHAAGINKQPAYRGAVYRCVRRAGHTTTEPPGHLCAGLLVAGSDRIPRSRTWRAEAVAR